MSSFHDSKRGNVEKGFLFKPRGGLTDVERIIDESESSSKGD